MSQPDESSARAGVAAAEQWARGILGLPVLATIEFQRADHDEELGIPVINQRGRYWRPVRQFQVWLDDEGHVIGFQDLGPSRPRKPVTFENRSLDAPEAAALVMATRIVPSGCEFSSAREVEPGIFEVSAARPDARWSCRIDLASQTVVSVIPESEE